jgi:general secretion pathway protein K
MRDETGRHRGSRGLALVAVLWTATLLSLLALGLGRSSTTGSTLVFHQIEASRAEALADAGIALAVLGLLDEDREWAWRADAGERVVAFAGAELRIRIRDEHGKLDLNSAPLDLIEALLRSRGLSTDAARAVAAAIDEHSLPAGPLGGPFVQLGQLRLVPGITPELYAAVRPALTVHTGSPGVDPYHAPPVLLDALPGLDAGLRARVRAAAGTPDDALGAELEAAIGEYLFWSPETHLTIAVEARTASGAAFVREATLEITASTDLSLAVRDWRRGEAPAEDNASTDL